VLSHWLDRMEGDAAFSKLVDEDRAVWSPIDRISGTLDKSLVEIFMPGYAACLNAARERLEDPLGGPGRPPAEPWSPCRARRSRPRSQVRAPGRSTIFWVGSAYQDRTVPGFVVNGLASSGL
jgi:hypothetical protein